MVTPVFLLGKSHGQRSLVGLQSMVLQRAGHDLATKQQQQIRNSAKKNFVKNEPK